MLTIPYVVSSELVIKRALSAGGQACVFFGVLTTSKKPVAVKVYAKNDENSNIYRTEYKILKSIRHRAIVKTLGRFENENYFFLVTEFLDGITLHKILESFETRGFYLSPLIINFMAQTLFSALNALMKDKSDPGAAAHGDLSIDNLIFTRTGQIKLFDFGACAIKEGLLFGKTRYLAPERYCGVRADFTSDLYSIGIILFESVTGRAFSFFKLKPAMRELEIRLKNDPGLFKLICALVSPSPFLRPRSIKEARSFLTPLSISQIIKARMEIASLVTCCQG